MKSFLSILALFLLIASCKENDEIPNPNPQVLSLFAGEAHGITCTSAIIDVTIANPGGAELGNRGICWSTSPIPSIADSVQLWGMGEGSFSVLLDSLLSNTIYYARPFVVEDETTYYGNQMVFTTSTENCAQDFFNTNLTYGTVSDIDGHIYKTIQIGNQRWMAENLRTSRYANGDEIPVYVENADWGSQTGGAGISYNNQPQQDCSYGRLYNWYTTTDTRNVCPAGWHVPDSNDWRNLTIHLDPAADLTNGNNNAGIKLKTANNAYWTEFPENPTNSSGFSAVTAPARLEGGPYSLPTDAAYYWSSDERTNDRGYQVVLNAGSTSLHVPYAFPKTNGLSVRCIQD
ncbi:MAG: hypothetical protein K0R65_550 [Crocinitomicaceae bacterium]|jgi:uncharacterized protein (TIGR02145 family)|nr:hypothetical protein [Crocinitomicaceae bacterium]